jgi:glucokinase
MAGPVRQGQGRITNGRLVLSERALTSLLGCPARLVNDFYALAASLPALKKLQQVGGGAPADGAKAVLGPGSGLGMAALVPVPGGWQVVPSEGGHADLAPGSPLELELLSVLQQSGETVCWETVLSGPGLVRLYRAVRTLWGLSPAADSEPEATPEWVARQGVGAADPLCHQALEMFFGLLGSAAGNLALTMLATGGVYVGGGIVPRLAEFAAASPLRRRFEERAGLSELVAGIPLYLILDEQPGLVGAIECWRSSGHHSPAIS